MRFILTHSSESRPALIVETRDHADEQAVANLRDVLFESSCPNGLLFDQEFCILLRDQFSTMDKESIVIEGKLPTDSILKALGPAQSGSLDQRVERWLRMLSTRWDDALPRDPEIAAPFIADIVPAASGSAVHPVRAGALR